MSERMEMCDLCDGSGYVRASTNASTPACVAAIRAHLGGKPELVSDMVAFVQLCATVLHLHPNQQEQARAILSRIENGNG